jgi:(2Fe-2S) ferredoxin
MRKVEEERLVDKVHLSRAGCVLKGQCREQGPFIVIYPQNIWYHRVTVNDVDRIVEHHLKNDQIVSKLLFFAPKSPKPNPGNA